VKRQCNSQQQSDKMRRSRRRNHFLPKVVVALQPAVRIHCFDRHATRSNTGTGMWKRLRILCATAFPMERLRFPKDDVVVRSNPVRVRLPSVPQFSAIQHDMTSRHTCCNWQSFTMFTSSTCRLLFSFSLLIRSPSLFTHLKLFLRATRVIRDTPQQKSKL
jgi:hypothetical protein